MKDEPVVILGAGLAGMAAAHRLGKRRRPYLLFEREGRPGGLVRSERVAGYTFDYTGHLLHMKRRETRDLVLKELGLEGRFLAVQRRSFIFSKGVYTRYPFQANTFGLPVDVVRECLEGFVQARLDEAARAARPAGRSKGPAGEGNFESWILRTFGPGIARHFMLPYNAKLWGVPPREMTTEWMGRFVPQPGLSEVLRGALQDRPEATGYNAHFLYPRSGGIEVLARGFAAKVEARLNTEAVEVDLKARQARFSDGSSVRFRRLISSLPLKTLVSLIPACPARVRRASARLRATGVLNVNFGVAGRNISDKHWIYVPEERFPFYRAGFYHNFSPAMAPRGCSSVYAEVSLGPASPRVDPARAAEKVRRGLIEMGVLKPGDRIAARFTAHIPGAYVVYDPHRAAAVAEIRDYLRENGVLSTGRWGSWEYGSMEDAIWQGIEAADQSA